MASPSPIDHHHFSTLFAELIIRTLLLSVSGAAVLVATALLLRASLS